MTSRAPRRLAAALTVLAAASGLAMAAGDEPEPPVVRGTTARGTVISTPDGGLAEVSQILVDRMRLRTEPVPPDLKLARGHVEARRWLEAEAELRRILEEIERQAGTVQGAGDSVALSTEARLLLAQVCRRTWRFRTAVFLVEGLVTEAGEQAGLDLLRELAEVSVLASHRKADDAVRRYRRAATKARDKAAQGHADALERQLKGDDVAAFPGEVPEHRDAARLAALRAGADRAKGNYLAAAEAADALAALAGDWRPGGCRKAYVKLTPRRKETEERYLAGGPEKAFRGGIVTAEAWVEMDRAKWLALWDHEKQQDMNGLAFLVRMLFPPADVSVTITVPRPANDTREGVVAVAQVRMAYGKSPEVTLITEQRWDSTRDAALDREMRDAEDERRGIRR